MRLLYKVGLLQLSSKAGLRRLLVQCTFTLFCTLILSHTAALQLRRAYLPPFSQKLLTELSSCFLVQLFVYLIFTAMLRAGHATRRDRFAKLLIVWPVSRWQQWLTLALPTIVLTLLTILVIGEPLAVILHKLGLSLPLSSAVLLVGSLSAFGLHTGLQSYRTAIRYLMPLLVATGEYVALRSAIDATSTDRTIIGYAVFVAGILLSTILLIPVGIHQVDQMRATTNHMKIVRTGWLPSMFWSYKIVIRSSMRIGIVVNILLSFAVILVAKHARIHLDQNIGRMSVSMLAGALATDIRGLFARNRPPEIVGLRGTNAFLCAALSAIFATSIISTLPLLAALIVSPDRQLFLLFSQLSLGICAGFAASILLVPANREITKQFLATVLCLVIVVGLPHIPQVSSLSSHSLSLTYLTVSCLLFCAAQFVELERNNFIWRKMYAAAAN